ncbi:MAG: beta-propeller domain-containing protein [Deltaproteobacteria bacterium]|nr:beta-propeller domain-containing protein [Deltaproteobacteria bacterium]
MTHSKLLGTLSFAAALAGAPAQAAGPQARDGCRQLMVQHIDAQIARELTTRAQRAQAKELDLQPSLADSILERLGAKDRFGQMVDRDAAPAKLQAAESAPSGAPSMQPRRSLDSAAKKEASAPSSYSRTNTQEESVDEGDIVKTDGRFIYHVSCTRSGPASNCRNELRIFKSWPASETRLVGRYAIPTRGPDPHVQQIYLHERSLAVIAGAPSSPATDVLLLDVRDPAKPRLEREVSIGGRSIESRMIGSRLYLATSNPGLAVPGGLTEDVETILANASEKDLSSGSVRAEAVLDSLEPRWGAYLANPGLPRATERLGNGSEVSMPIYGCRELTVDRLSQGGQILSLTQIDLSRSEPPTGSGVSGFGQQSTLYASEGAFYLAEPVAPSTPGWSSSSLIRKFDLSRGGRPEFAGRGLVRGQLLNQFSMSEHEGHLRVATSDNWASNNVFVLRTVEDRLEKVGAIENLAGNERIFAVRMMGDRGYVVTFRRTDPLFTLDLSEPTGPKVVGELKIEGYSTYLHPLGAGRLLAVGQDADQSGRATGFHLQIFDVSDPRQPRRTHHRKLEAASTSSAESDHHAFMFEPSTGTLAMPWRGENYWGLIAYGVDVERGFTDLGKVNHAIMYKNAFRRACRTFDSGLCAEPNGWWTSFSREDLVIDRVVAIERDLYSVGPSGLMVHHAGSRLIEKASVLVRPPVRDAAFSEVAWNGRR